MSFERRSALLDAVSDEWPGVGLVVDNRDSLLEGNWDMLAFIYQQSFNALWDHAVTQPGGLSVLPLLMICRQSIELSIKAAIEGTTVTQPPGGHDLTELFDHLLKVRREHGRLEPDDDDYTAKVKARVAEFQELDQRADRWRYPTDRKGRAHKGVNVDLDRLFQVHAMITGWCDHSSAEAEQCHIHGG